MLDWESDEDVDYGDSLCPRPQTTFTFGKQPSLPAEIHDLVLDEVAQEIQYHDRLECLSHCSLVSRNFAKRCRRHIFSEITITDDDWRVRPNSEVVERIHGLRDVLCARQISWDDLAFHIRSLTLDLNNEEEVESGWEEDDSSDDETSNEEEEGVEIPYSCDTVVLNDGSLAAILDTLSPQNHGALSFSMSIRRLDRVDWMTLSEGFRSSFQRFCRSPCLFSLHLSNLEHVPTTLFIGSFMRSLSLRAVSGDTETNSDHPGGESHLVSLVVYEMPSALKFISDDSLRGLKTLGIPSPPLFSIPENVKKALCSVTTLEIRLFCVPGREFNYDSSFLSNVEILKIIPELPITMEENYPLEHIIHLLERAKTLKRLNEVRFEMTVGRGYMGQAILHPDRQWKDLDFALSSPEFRKIKRITVELHNTSVRDGPFYSREKFNRQARPLLHQSFPSLCASTSVQFSVVFYTAGYSVPWCIIQP